MPDLTYVIRFTGSVSSSTKASEHVAKARAAAAARARVAGAMGPRDEAGLRTRNRTAARRDLS